MHTNTQIVLILLFGFHFQTKGTKLPGPEKKKKLQIKKTKYTRIYENNDESTRGHGSNLRVVVMARNGSRQNAEGKSSEKYSSLIYKHSLKCARRMSSVQVFCWRIKINGTSSSACHQHFKMAELTTRVLLKLFCVSHSTNQTPLLRLH